MTFGAIALDVAGRLVMPKPHASDAHGYQAGGYLTITQISTDGFAAYPEAVDLAFGPYVKYGTIIKDYKNANMIYTPSEMVGTKRTGINNIEGKRERSICTSHVERLNGTQRLFPKRLNRLTLCFSKKLRNLEAAFAMFACYYNYCWQTRKPGSTSKKRGTAAMMAGIAGHVWSFDELFDAVLKPCTAGLGHYHQMRYNRTFVTAKVLVKSPWAADASGTICPALNFLVNFRRSRIATIARTWTSPANPPRLGDGGFGSDTFGESLLSGL